MKDILKNVSMFCIRKSVVANIHLPPSFPLQGYTHTNTHTHTYIIYGLLWYIYIHLNS